MKASGIVAVVWVITAAVFWSAAGWAAADGSAEGAFAYVVCPLVLAPGVGLVMGDLDRKRQE
jgi:hypothetical protein